MENDRLRVPVDTAYVAAIGLATYCFARLEWDVVYCGEELSPGYINTVAKRWLAQLPKMSQGLFI